LYYLRRLLDTDPIYRELNNLKPLGRSLTKEEADNKIAGNDEKLEGLLKKAREVMFESLMIDLNEAVTALLSDFVNASDQSSKSKILNGTYLNSLSDLRGRFIPRVSIFQLLNVGIKESTVPLAEALVDFIRKDTLTSLEGKRFESFHAYWERLMHECMLSVQKYKSHLVTRILSRRFVKLCWFRIFNNLS
jgi:hypothetical protein